MRRMWTGKEVRRIATGEERTLHNNRRAPIID
jgi:hypothetical protein